MNASSKPDRSWFRSTTGRRFGVEMAVILLVKLAALVLLYFVFIVPLTHVDASPSATRAHMLAPGAAGGSGEHDP